MNKYQNIEVPRKFQSEIGTLKFVQSALKASITKEIIPQHYISSGRNLKEILPGDVRFCVKG